MVSARQKQYLIDVLIVLQTRSQWLSCVGIPHTRALVVTGRGNPAAIRTERRIADRGGVSERCANSIASARIPDPRGVVLARCDDQTIVRTKAGVQNTASMFHSLAYRFSGCRIPELRLSGIHRIIRTGSQDASSITAENCVADGAAMLQRRKYRFAHCHIECLELAPGAHDQIARIRTESHHRGPIGKTYGGENRRSGRSVQQFDRFSAPHGDPFAIGRCY